MSARAFIRTVGSTSHTCDGCQRSYALVRYNGDIEASRALKRAYYSTHTAVILARNRKDAAAHPEWRQNRTAWFEANRDHLNAYMRARFAKASGEDRERYRVRVRNRRARIKASGGKHTALEIIGLLAKQHGKCANCLTKLKLAYHVDHIVPSARGGSNDITNLQILCAPCNMSKFAKDPIEWARANGRLL